MKPEVSSSMIFAHSLPHAALWRPSVFSIIRMAPPVGVNWILLRRGWFSVRSSMTREMIVCGKTTLTFSRACFGFSLRMASLIFW